MCLDLLLFFFFQAEDGIRDVAVTGVQTCALPISPTTTARFKLPLEMCGNGRPGSNANGVRTGNTVSRKYESIADRSSCVSEEMPKIRIPSRCRAGNSVSRKRSWIT